MIESGEMAFPWEVHTNELSNTKFSVSNIYPHKKYYSDWPVALLYLVICVWKTINEKGYHEFEGKKRRVLKRAMRILWEGFEKGKGRESWFNYTIISKKNKNKVRIIEKMLFFERNAFMLTAGFFAPSCMCKNHGYLFWINMGKLYVWKNDFNKSFYFSQFSKERQGVLQFSLCH